MRILAFSDLHNDHQQARTLVEMSTEADVVIGAGDFCNAHRGLRETIEILSEISAPAVLVPGNAETDTELREAAESWQNAVVLHGGEMLVAGIKFFGIGGGIPVTPFGSWSFDFTEEQAEVLLADCPHAGVLVSHSPPWQAVDVSSRGANLGSQTIRTTVERCSPSLVVCGHVHHCAGQEARIGDTRVINAGPHGVFLSVDGSCFEA